MVYVSSISAHFHVGSMQIANVLAHSPVPQDWTWSQDYVQEDQRPNRSASSLKSLKW